MNTATRIAVVAIAILAIAVPAVSADSPPEEEPSDDGDRSACIMLDEEGRPPVIVDPDECLPDNG